MRALAFLAFVALAAPAQEFPPAPEAAAVAGSLDGYLQRAFKPGAPGAAVLVLKDGKVLLRKGYGLASVELDTPVRPDSVFHAASVGKQFTAAALLRLAEQGRVDLLAPVGRYLQDAPEAWSGVTLEHLLTHTSGIGNLWNDPAFQRREREDLSPAQLMAAAAAKPLLYPPGTGFTYASVNYTVLARVLERVTGQPYAAYLEAQFFKPLGMTHTFFDGTPALIPGRVQPYAEGPRPAPFMSPALGFGAGSFYTTTEDLARWTLALQGGRVLKPESLRRMDMPYRLKDGTNTHYGYGLRPHGTPEDPYLESNGDIPGFHSEVVYEPRSGLFVAILTNTEDLEMGLDPLAKRVAALAAGHPLPEPQAARLSAAELARFCGRYADGSAVRTIRLEQGHLVSAFPGSPAWPITPLSPTECFFDTDPDLRLRFELQDGVFIRVLVVRADRFPGPTYQRVP